MKISRNYLLIFGVVLAITACKTTKKQEATQEKEKSTHARVLTEPIKLDTQAMRLDTSKTAKVDSAIDTLYMSLRKTPCYGRCPVYSADIYTSGYVVYNGKRFVEKEGRHVSRMSEDDLSSIRHMARTINYFGLEDKYDRAVSDLPSTYTTIHFNGQRKTVMNRMGGPDALKEFENHVEKILNGLEWKAKADATGK